MESLVSAGARVTVADSLVTGRPEHLAAVEPRIRLVTLPVLRALESHALDVGEFDLIFHVAANAYIPPSVEDPAMDYELNLHTTFTLLEAIRRSGSRVRLVNFSTAGVYGDPVRLPIREDDLTVPISPYGVSKLAGERYLAVYCKLYGLRGTSLRLFSVYGPRQKKQVVYDLLRKVRMNTGSVEVIGDGTQERDMVYVKDVVQAALLAASVAPGQGEVYNVASGETHSISEIVAALCRTCGAAPEIRYTGSVRPGDAQKWSVDLSRLKSLGYVPRTSLAEGLEAVRKWYDESDEK